MIEIEVKFPLNDEGSFVDKLLKSGFLKSKSLNQTDIYFNSPHHNFAETDEALRIRLTPNKTELTYKGPKTSQKSKLREEISVEISSSKDLLSIFQKLGFEPVAKVEKERTVFVKNDFEITIDRVKDLGTFTEIEVVIEDPKNKENKENELLNICKQFGFDLREQIRLSYLELILNSEEK